MTPAVPYRQGSSMKELAPLKPGDRQISATDINAVFAELVRQGKFTVEGADLESTGASVMLRVALPLVGFWAKLTSESSGKYAWTEVERTAAGTFTTLAGGRTGTTALNSARDLNAATGIAANTYVWLVEGFGQVTGGALDQEYLFDHASASGSVGPVTFSATGTVLGGAGVANSVQVMGQGPKYFSHEVAINTEGRNPAVPGSHIAFSVGSGLYGSGGGAPSINLFTVQYDPTVAANNVATFGTDINMSGKKINGCREVHNASNLDLTSASEVLVNAAAQLTLQGSTVALSTTGGPLIATVHGQIIFTNQASPGSSIDIESGQRLTLTADQDIVLEPLGTLIIYDSAGNPHVGKTVTDAAGIYVNGLRVVA